MNLMPAPDKLAYTIKEATTATGMGKTMLYELIAKGELTVTKVNGRTLIQRKHIEEMLDRHVVDRAA